MESKKTEFQVTIGYRAVICFTVKCETDEEAKQIALAKVKDIGIYEGDLQDETYAADGILNMDRTWNLVNG